MDFTEEKKENLIQVDLKEIMESSFLDYSMSVIVSRALPDVRDGLKPVHRRILYTMYENSLWPESAPIPSVPCSVVIIRTVMLRFTMHWYVLRRTSPCVICW